MVWGVDCAHLGKFLLNICHLVAVTWWLGLESSQRLLHLYDWPLILAVRWDLSQHVASPCDLVLKVEFWEIGSLQK